MQMQSWARLLMLTLLAPISASPFADGIAPKAAPGKQAGTMLEFRTSDGGNHRLRVKQDQTVPSVAKPSDIKLVGEIGQTAVILIDSYPSIPGGMSLCQAGQERFLRVISVAEKQPKETFRIKLESCRDNIELTSPGIEWQPDRSTLRIEWLQGPDKQQKPDRLSLRIGTDGKAVKTE